MRDINTRLVNIDLLRERTGLSYTEANTLLDQCDDDIVEALMLHEKMQANKGNWFNGSLFQSIRTLIHRGNVTHLRISRDDKVFLEVPLTAGIVGVALLPKLAFLGGIACLMSQCRLDFKREGENEWEEYKNDSLDD